MQTVSVRCKSDGLDRTEPVWRIRCRIAQWRELMASFMADSQLPWGLDALAGAVSEPAWKTKPSFYLVATEDKMIPPPAQQAMAGRCKAKVQEVRGSHAIYVSKAKEVAEFISQAASA